MAKSKSIVKKIIKWIKILVLIILLNQVLILLLNNSIQDGKWKINSSKRLNRHDFIDFKKMPTNLKWNLIEENGEFCGIVQLYIGKKIVISNLTLTEWYVYENKAY